MADLAPLAIEIAKPDYDAMSNAAIADSVNVKRVAVKKMVDIADAVTLLREQGSWYTIKQAAMTNPAAFAAVDLVQDLRAQTINMENAMVQQMGAALVATGLMTQEQWDAVVSLGTVQTPWTEVHCGLPYVSEFDVAAVRA